MNTTSASLLQRLRQPAASDAWSRFVDLYTPLLFYWTRQAGLQDSDAADVVQDILVTLLQHLPAFDYDPGRSFRSWLCTVTRNRCREQLRKQAARAGVPLREQPDSRQHDPAAALCESDYEAFILQRAMQLMRQEFAPVTWQACWRHVVEGQSAREVADSLGITLNAVYLAKSRVLRRLRQDLEGLLG